MTAKREPQPYRYYCDECGFIRKPSECAGSDDCKVYRLVPVQ